jgi:hypothetical protein
VVQFQNCDRFLLGGKQVFNAKYAKDSRRTQRKTPDEQKLHHYRKTGRTLTEYSGIRFVHSQQHATSTTDFEVFSAFRGESDLAHWGGTSGVRDFHIGKTVYSARVR